MVIIITGCGRNEDEGEVLIAVSWGPIVEVTFKDNIIDVITVTEVHWSEEVATIEYFFMAEQLSNDATFTRSGMKTVATVNVDDFNVLEEYELLREGMTKIEVLEALERDGFIVILRDDVLIAASYAIMEVAFNSDEVYTVAITERFSNDEEAIRAYEALMEELSEEADIQRTDSTIVITLSIQEFNRLMEVEDDETMVIEEGATREEVRRVFEKYSITVIR